jgi:hypothetical protein
MLVIRKNPVPTLNGQAIGGRLASTISRNARRAVLVCAGVLVQCTKILQNVTFHTTCGCKNVTIYIAISGCISSRTCKKDLWEVSYLQKTRNRMCTWDAYLLLVYHESSTNS